MEGTGEEAEFRGFLLQGVNIVDKPS